MLNFFLVELSKFLTSVEFSSSLSTSTLPCFHGCCSFISVFRTKRMMRTCALFGAVVNTHRIIVFPQTTVSMEVKPRMELTL